MNIRVESSTNSISEQFVMQLEQLAVAKEQLDDNNSNEIVYHILPQYGEGTVRVHHLMSDMMLTVFDAVFYEDLLMDFKLPANHFEIEYCVSGRLGVKIGDAAEQIFRRNAVSVSTSRESAGSLRHIANEPYKCISLSGDLPAIAAYLGSAGAPLWQETFERMSIEKRSDYFMGISAPKELTACFFEILNCSLPIKMRALYFEGKIMEILSRLIACEISDHKEDMLLDPFEMEQIKKVPGLLADNLFDLPTIVELSKVLTLNRNKLMCGFKQLFGDTIYGYHRKMCLSHAATLLSHTYTSVHDIALDVGYSSASNFCCAFKKEYGVTPIQYRSEIQPVHTEKKEACNMI